MRRLILPALFLPLFVAAPPAARPQAPSAAPSSAPAEISADLGPCSALISVTGADAKPVYGARINTRVQYGAFGVKKLDLEAFTGPDGTVKITKLPESLKKPMIIHVSKDDKADQVEFKPSERCRATFSIVLK